MLIAYSILVTILLFVAGFYLYRLARIIMLLEDDFATAIDTLENLEQTVENTIKMQLFYDNEEVRKSVTSIMDTLKLARIDVNNIIRKFVDRSKNKYIVEIIDEEEEFVAMPRRQMMQRRNPALQAGDMSDYNY